MTNLRSDAPITRRIVYAFIDFLNSVEPAPGVDDEGLEVAKDCLNEFFQLNQLSRSDQPEPNLLVNLFTSHETSRQNEPKPGNIRDSPAMPVNSVDTDSETALKIKDDAVMAEASDIGVSRDELFGQFFSALEKIHYFSTTPGGGDDEHMLLERATGFFHDAINEMQSSGCKTCDQRSLAEALKTLGNKAMQSNAYADAIERYTFAIALCDNAVYYCNRAAAYTQIGKYDEAIKDSLRAIDIDPTYSKAYSRLGFAYYAQGNYSDAINKGLKKALELDPDNNSVKENLKLAEQKLREQRERRGRNQGYRNFFPGGTQAGPFTSTVSYDIGGPSSNLASMFMNVPSYTQSSANVPSEDSRGTPSTPQGPATAFSNIASMFTNNSSAEQNYGTETNPPPFASMPFDPSAIPANIADMYLNLGNSGAPNRSEIPQDNSANGSGNININLGGNQNPEELMSTLSAMMGMFSPGAPQGDQQPGTGDGRSSSS